MSKTTIAVIGMPGSGKTTRVWNAKKSNKNVFIISSRKLLRGVATTEEGFVPDEIVIELVKKELELAKKHEKKLELAGEHQIIILDGIPGNLEQLYLLLEMGIKIDRVIHFYLPEYEAIQRSLDKLVCSNCQKIYSENPFKRPHIEGICDKCGSELKSENERKIFDKLDDYEYRTLPVTKAFSGLGITVLSISALGPTDILENYIKF